MAKKNPKYVPKIIATLSIEECTSNAPKNTLMGDLYFSARLKITNCVLSATSDSIARKMLR
jgi:hypothetical protein